MVTIRASFDGLDKLQGVLRNMPHEMRREVSQAVQAHALDTRSDIQRRVQRGPATGRMYGNHRASAPGEAPATDTGTLVSSITYRQAAPLTAEIESRLPYAAMLEFGTVRMDPRPSWTPSVEAKRPDFVRRVTDAIARAQR